MNAKFDLGNLLGKPLRDRVSLTRVENVMIDPERPPGVMDDRLSEIISKAAGAVRSARKSGSSCVLIFGAHLVRNGGARIITQLMDGGWITHLATNGASSIHDWEYAYQGASTEDVAHYIAQGQFGIWEETGRYLNLALLDGGLLGLGYGASVGRFIEQERISIPSSKQLHALLVGEAESNLTAARAEAYQVMRRYSAEGVDEPVTHPWKDSSVFGSAYQRGVPLTVHPGIGYDIIANHPLFNGGAIGRAAGIDFASICRSVYNLDGGVVMSIGSAIMGPQVFEKAVSCVNNIRLQEGRDVVRGHRIFVVDLQPGGSWGGTTGEPAKDDPSYYLRFCKSYSRTGGTMEYVQCHNTSFLHNLLWALR